MDIQDMLDNGTGVPRPTMKTAVTKTRTKNDMMDELVWTYHDEAHKGAYVECFHCTEIILFVNRFPRFFRVV